MPWLAAGQHNWEMQRPLPAQGMVNWLMMHSSPLTITSSHQAARDANARIVPFTPVFLGKRRERPAFLI
jgi:hypothetical protein